jgi:radical SAM-linked protein
VVPSVSMRVRVRFSKTGKVRFTSHRDVARMWERALRRASLRVMYTEGFSPRPKMHFGLALSTGHESMAEYIDIDMVEAFDITDLPARLTPCLPVGLEATAAVVIERSAPSLQAEVTFCSWEFTMRGVTPAELEVSVRRLLDADTVMLTRSRKGIESRDDVRSAIKELSVRRDPVVLMADIATEGRGLRPVELVQVLFPELDDVEERIGRVLRTHQWIEADGARVEPLPLEATTAPHTEVCV